MKYFRLINLVFTISFLVCFFVFFLAIKTSGFEELMLKTTYFVLAYVFLITFSTIYMIIKKNIDILDVVCIILDFIPFVFLIIYMLI